MKGNPKVAQKTLKQARFYFQYLKVDARARRWGMYVTTCGKSSIRPSDPYPPVEHPAMYHFSWASGRELKDYQLIHIENGSGTFETKTFKKRIQRGSLILLSPGIWHRYRPDPEVGWEETWVGFAGEFYDTLFKKGFFAGKHVIQLPKTSQLSLQFETLLGIAQAGCPALQQTLAAHTNLLIAAAYGATIPSRVVAVKAGSAMVQRAREFMLDAETRHLPLEKAARFMGVSYSNFRRTFREHTGLSPHQYRIQIKLNQARQLLLTSELTIKEVAFQSGFDEEPYFCRVFKKTYGRTPGNYRRQ